jgi:hypothetical protein
MTIRWLILLGGLCWLGAVAGAVLSVAAPAQTLAQGTGTVSGIVTDDSGPVAGATVRVQGTTNKTLSGTDGTFTLAGLAEGAPVTISAWKDLYYCAKVEGVVPPAEDITLLLRLVQTNDNPDYEWIPPVGETSCASCKAAVTQIWLDNDAHAGASTNPRFLTMYNGTDVNGSASPITRYGNNPDYGRIPLRPDLTQPYYGPGYKLDFPTTAGNCAACHTPGAAVNVPYGTDPNTVTGADTYGVHCDFCHKIADVTLDPITGLPYPNRPGVLSMDIRRPFPEDEDRYQLFFGTFDDDNVPMEDTYLPLIEESQFCAPCHFGVFWDTVIYNSFGEWLESSYSRPDSGKTCQQCHMPAPSVLNGEVLTNVAPGLGGIERDPQTLYAHTNPGAGNATLLQNTAELAINSAERHAGALFVNVTVTNTGAGHNIPTDSPLRQIFLVVTATDPDGHPLELRKGPVLPDWAGDLAGSPGVYYALILQEKWTEIMPTGAYWNPTRVVEDTRIPALAMRSADFVFGSLPEGTITIEARLIFRRAYYELMQQKGWEVPDIEMEHITLEEGR